MKKLFKTIFLIISVLILTGCNGKLHFHDGNKWTVKEATCISHGYKYIKCDKCDYIIKGEIIPATGHVYENWEVLKEAQLFEVGVEQSKCINCDYIYQREIPATHVHEIKEEFVIDEEPTCRLTGIKSYHCVKDDCTYRTNITSIPMKSHNLIFNIETESTCITYGKYAHYYCETCGGYFINNKLTDGKVLLKPRIDHNTYILKTSDNEYIIKCNMCEETLEEINVVYTEELEYIKNEDNNSYIVTGLKSSFSNNIVIIPEQFNGLPVTKIAEKAFFGKSFEYLIMSDTIIEIGNNAFESCSSLKNIKLSKSLELIGRYAFSGCTHLSNINLSKKLKSIGISAFNSCINMKNILLEGTINDWLNVSLENKNSNPLCITKGNVYTYDEELNDYIKQTHIEFPKGIETIPSYNIACFDSVETIYIPNTVKSISGGVFSNYSYLKEVYYDGSIEEWNEISFSSSMDNPFTWNFKAVLYLYDNDEYKEVTELNIPEGVENIKQYAFSGFRFITKLSLPKSLKSIETSAFYGLANCKELYYSGNEEDWAGITFMDSDANPMVLCPYKYFLNKNGEYQELTELDLRNMTELNRNTFINMSTVNKVYISNKLENCRNLCFDRLVNLKEVYFEGTIREWFNINFELSSNPLSVAGADLYVLNEDGEYYKVEFLVIPDDVTVIRAEQFYKCTSIEFIYIHKGVTDIQYRAFDGCKGILIYCELDRIPSTWGTRWCDNTAVINLGYEKEQ